MKTRISDLIFLALIVISASLSAAAQPPVQTGPSGIISTAAGDGFLGDNGNGGLATRAQLIYPQSVAVDSSGNFYIADPDAQVVRKVTVSTGIITVYAGTGFGGYSGDSGAAIAAELDRPWALAMDVSNNLFIADTRNNVIRKVNGVTGVITTVAGNGVGAGTPGDDDFCGGLTFGVKATTTSLCYPEAVAVDNVGNLYIGQGDQVFEVGASSGTLSGFAGGNGSGYSGDGGPAANAAMQYVAALAVDGPGNLYIADSSNCAIRKVTATTGMISSLVGNPNSNPHCNYGVSPGDGGPATAASILYPDGVAVDASGDVFIADSSHSSIRVIDAGNGNIYTVAGTYYTYTNGGTTYTYGSGGYSGDGGPAIAAELAYPEGIALDFSGNLYIADEENSVIRMVSGATAMPAETPVITPASGGIAGSTQISINSPITGATIYYTTNNTTPSTSSTKYTVPFTVSSNTVVEAFSTIAGSPNTDAAVAYYLYAPPPTFTPGSETFSVPTTITIADGGNQPTICFTSDGSDPTSSSSRSCFYETSFTTTVSNTTTLKAAAQICGPTGPNQTSCVWSATTTATYTYAQQAATPAFSVPPGQYNTAQNVIITESTSGATIYYAINGTPTTSSTKYTPGATITVSSTETLEAIAVASGYLNSPVASAYYIIVSPTHTLKSIAVTPASAVMQVGSTLQFSAVGTYSDSSTQTLTNSVTWASSKTAVAKINASGLLSAAAAGSTSVKASLSGKTSNSASVTVGPKTPLAYTAPTEPVGTTSATQTATIWLPAGFKLGSIAVVTQGAPNLDFKFVAGGTCKVGTAYTAAETCTAKYTFAPEAPGARMGAINLYDQTAPTPVLQATTYLSGTGTGPLAGFYPGVQTKLATSSQNCLSAVAVDAGWDVYEANACNGAVYKETPSSGGYSQTTVASGPMRPTAIAVDGSGNVFIADSENEQILKETLSAGGYLQSVIASPSLNETNTVGGVAVDGSGNVYIGNAANATVFKETLTANGYTQSTIIIQAFCPYGVAVDGSGNVYASAECGGQVLKATPSGSGYTQSVIASGLNQPYGVAVDASGDLYVGEYNSGNSLVVKESPTASGYVQSSIAQGIVEVEGIALDGSGNLYLAAWAAQQVTKIDFADPPSLAFATTPPGFTSPDSPQTVTLWNDGNAPLHFPVPASGDNPSISLNFTLTSNISGACPLVTNSSANPGSLTPATSCLLPVSFAPTTTGVFNGTLALTDNNMNAASVTQTLPLSGTSLALKSLVVTPATDAIQLGETVPYTATATFSDNSTENASSAAVWSSSKMSVATVSPSGLATSAATGSTNITAAWAGVTSAAASLTVGADVPTSYTAPTEAVGTASATQTATIWIPGNFTLGSIAVVTQGAANLDFEIAAGSTCAGGTAYTEGQTCNVNYTFKPMAPGTRVGAIDLFDNTSPTPVLQATVFLSGTGTGPLTNFYSAGSQSALPLTNLPQASSVAIDAAGNLYVATWTNSQIWKYAPPFTSSSQHTVIGVGSIGAADIVVDGGGNLYIADETNSRVLKETLLPNGSYAQSVVANAAVNGLNGPYAVAVDVVGNVYIADSYSYRVLKETLTADGYVQSTIASSLAFCEGIAVDASGDVFIASWGGQILKETPSATSYTQSTIITGLNSPSGIAIDPAGNLYITEYYGKQVLKEMPSASGYTPIAIGGGFDLPWGIAIDGTGSIYIADWGLDKVFKEDFADPPSLSFATTPVGSTSADSPQTVTLWNDGNAALTFPIPTSGNNPSISTNFTLTSGSATDCPLVAHTASAAGTLAAGANCLLPISFTPTTTGTITGSLVLTDNNLDVSNATQSIALSGTGNSNSRSSSTSAPNTIGWR